MSKEYTQIIIGVAIIVAVAVDRLSDVLQQRRLARMGRRHNEDQPPPPLGGPNADRGTDPHSCRKETQMRKSWIYAAALCLAAAGSAFAQEKKMTIGIVAKSQSNPVFQAGLRRGQGRRQGARAEVRRRRS